MQLKHTVIGKHSVTIEVFRIDKEGFKVEITSLNRVTIADGIDSTEEGALAKAWLAFKDKT